MIVSRDFDSPGFGIPGRPRAPSLGSGLIEDRQGVVALQRMEQQAVHREGRPQVRNSWATARVDRQRV